MAAVLAAPLVGLGVSQAAATTIATLGLYAATTAASIFLQMAMAEKPQEEIGTKLTATLGGAVNQSFHIGDKESAGSFLYKGTWGRSGGVPNAYLVKVYLLSDRPVEGFHDYVWVDGVKCNYNPNETSTIDGVGVGHPIPKFDQGGGHRLWVKFHDGNQTNADNYLVAKFGTGARQWTNNHVGRGRAYMIVTQKYDKKNPSGEVEVLPVIKNSRLYDFRNDTTNGGSGAQRYNDDGTWGVNPGNPITAAYHIMRGIYRGNEWIYGGQQWPATRFDVSTWTAAANKCDSDLAAGGGGTLKWARVGAEIDVSEEPWTVIERLLKACNGRIVESGGKFKVYVGGIGASVFSFSDNDVILSEELTGRVFPTRDDIANTVNGTYIEPANAGEAKAIKPRTKNEYIEADGDVRKMTLDQEYVRDNRQAQRVAELALKDNRRFRTFVVALPPYARKLEPCDIISWTSERFQFTDKKFILGDVVLRDDGNVVINMREADAADANWNPLTDENPFETGVFEDLPEPTQTFVATVTAVPFTDEDGKNRRPAIRIQASLDDEFVDCEALRFQVRKRFGDQKVIHRGRSVGFFEVGNPNYGDIQFTSSAFIPMRGKQVQVRYKIDPESDRETTWSDWANHTITLADLGIDDDDTSDELLAAPTGLSVTKVQEKDEDGTIRTFLELDSTAAAWAGPKADFIYEVTVAGRPKPYRIKSGDSAARFRVNKTGVLHTIRARMKSGVGRLSNWTSSIGITPAKKSTDAGAVTGISITKKNGANIIKWDRISDPDNREVAIYRGTSNVFASMTEIGRTKSTKWRDDDNITKGTRYYYRVLPVDTSDNVGSIASAAVDEIETGLDDTDTDDSTLAAPTGLTVSKVQDKDEDGTIRTFLKLDCTPPAWATTKTTYVYSITVGADEFTVKVDGTKARFRVNKTGVLHTVKVRGVKGIGTKGSWSASTGITPSKKSADASAVTGVSINRKNGFNIVKWDAITDPDNREVAIYRGTTNVLGSMIEIGRTKGTKWRDDDNITKGVRYYYRVVPVDTSNNVGTAVASLPVDDVETGIGTGDTDASLLAAPTGISIFQANRDVDQDGKVDIAMRTTFSGGVAGAAGYEVQWEDNAGQTATVRADGGSWWFPANTTRSYRARWRTINWVGAAGPWSSYTSYVSPSPTTGAPSVPSSVTTTSLPLGFRVNWVNAGEFDYSHSEICVGTSVSPDANNIVGYATGDEVRVLYFQLSSTQYAWVRRVNTSGLKSSWVRTSTAIDTGRISTVHIVDGGIDGQDLANNIIGQGKLIAGAASNIAFTSSGTSMGSVNVGSGYTRTYLSLSFKMTSNTANVTVTLGNYSVSIDFVAGNYCTITTSESGGGNFDANKNAGNISGCQITAVGVY